MGIPNKAFFRAFAYCQAVQVSALRTSRVPQAAPRRATAGEAGPVDTFTPTYYDKAKDDRDVARYYSGLSAQPTYAELKRLVQTTHTTRFGFDPEKRLFPWIDLRPNGRLSSIYSAEPVPVDGPIHSKGKSDFVRKVKVKAPGRQRADGTVGPPRNVNKKIDFREQAKDWTKILQENPTDAVLVAQRIAMVEGHRYYNAEHSVPQWMFDGDRVPKGDMHHLFTCERDTNSRRGCRPYADVEHKPENRNYQGWAPKEINAFEPDAGKGAVARAALYFLVRYPGKIGNQEGEYTPKDLETLLRWHRENPVSLYELHRNQAISEVQGNRNPFIDHPEWAEKVDFTPGFYAPPEA